MRGQLSTYTVAEVGHKVLDHEIPRFDLGIKPFCKSLLLDSNPPLLLRKCHPRESLIMRRFSSSKGVDRRTGAPLKAPRLGVGRQGGRSVGLGAQWRDTAAVSSRPLQTSSLQRLFMSPAARTRSGGCGDG